MINERAEEIRANFAEEYGEGNSWLGGKILDSPRMTLEYARVFDVELVGEGKYAWFEDGCDGCFGYPLNKSEMTRLILELSELCERMEE